MLQTSDDIARFDNDMESYLKGIEKKIIEFDPSFEFKIKVKGETLTLEEAIAKFSWEKGKYSKSKKTIPEILAKIATKFEETKKNVKERADAYQAENDLLKSKQKADQLRFK